MYRSLSDAMRRCYGTKVLNPAIDQLDGFSFYDANYDDNYIGDYCIGDDGQQLSSLPGFISDLCAGYILNRIIIPGDPVAPVFDPIDYDDVEVSTTTTTTNVVSPMLSDFIQWSQDNSPYNDRLNYNFGRANFGCVNIAMGKIMAYFAYPETFQYYNYTIDWDAIVNNPSSIDGMLSVSYLLLKLFEDNASVPFLTNATFALPAIARDNFVRYGYNDVNYTSYNTATVTSALRDGCPVFVRALNQIANFIPDIISSHAWNIDGYKTVTTTKVYTYYLNGVVVDTSTTTSTKTMVHCAWGWGVSMNPDDSQYYGYCDGYFVSGLFNLSASSAEFDNNHNAGAENDNFAYFIKTITYSHP